MKLLAWLPNRKGPLVKKLSIYGGDRRQCPCRGLGILLQFPV